MIYKNAQVIRDMAIKSEKNWRIIYDGKLLDCTFTSPSRAKAHLDTMTFFQQGRDLSLIYRNNKYNPLKYGKGPDGFSKFCKDQIGIEYRQAKYYMQVYKTFSDLGKSAEDLVGTGFVKAVLVAQLGNKLTQKNVDQWLKKAARLDRQSLKKAIRAASKKRS